MTDLRNKLQDILDDFTEMSCTNQKEIIDRIIVLFNEPCTCTSEETTGHTKFDNCNICGRMIKN